MQQKGHNMNSQTKLIANFHTHTTRCRHADGEDREYVEAAIKAGYKVLGFSDHCPWAFPEGYDSTIRMKLNEIDGYFSSLESLKKEYASDVKIYIGYETEYYPELIPAQDEILKDYPVDYMIQGQHNIQPEYRDQYYTGAETFDEKRLEDYVELCIAGMKTGRYLYLAHPDLINYAGDKTVFNKHMTKLFTYLKEENIPLEFNILGFFQERSYPSRKFLELAKEVGNNIIIGVDAHSPSLLADTKTIKRAVSMISEYDIPLYNGDFLEERINAGKYVRYCKQIKNK